MSTEKSNAEDSAAPLGYAEFRHLLGETVKTPDGIGVLIGVQTPFSKDGIRPERILLTVWFPRETRRWMTSWTYEPCDVVEA